MSDEIILSYGFQHPPTDILQFSTPLTKKEKKKKIVIHEH